MPNFDKTGPRGEGPMTGRGMGDCVEPINKLPKKKTINTDFPCGRGRGLPPCGPNGRGFGKFRGGK